MMEEKRAKGSISDEAEGGQVEPPKGEKRSTGWNSEALL